MKTFLDFLTQPGPHYPKIKAFAIICLSMILFGGLGGSSLFFYKFLQKRHAENASYVIQRIVQTSSEYESLKTPFFAQILGLSIDQSTNLYAFDAKAAEQRLLNTFVIKEVKIKKIKPHTLFIDYMVRKPFVSIANFANTVMDEEGVLFPIDPYFFPKKLPEVYLGSHSLNGCLEPWGKVLCDYDFEILQSLLQQLKGETLEFVDLSQIMSSTLGRRELVVRIKKKGCSHLLRLDSRDYRGGIIRYKKLLNESLCEENKACIIDLRLPQVAYLSQEEVML